MRPSPKSLRALQKDEQKKEVEAENGFTSLVRREIEALLKMSLEPREKNATIANAIKFLVVQNKLGGDDDGFWGSGD
jgi:hypothetical protein